MAKSSQTGSMNFDIDTSAIEEVGRGLAITLSETSAFGNGIGNVADLDAIGESGVEMARSLLKSNGNHHPGKRKGRGSNSYYGTGALSRSLTYSVKGRQLKLSAPAVDKYGHSYAGYVEYGSKTRDGKPQGPWPFLRPALQFMVDRTKMNLGDAIINLMRQNNVPLMEGSTHGSLSVGNKKVSAPKSADTRERYARDIRRGWGSTNNSTTKNPARAWSSHGDKKATSTFYKNGKG